MIPTSGEWPQSSEGKINLKVLKGKKQGVNVYSHVITASAFPKGPTVHRVNVLSHDSVVAKAGKMYLFYKYL